MKYETIKNALCDFCEPDNWEDNEQYHQKGSYTQYIWTGNNNPMALAESALDELDLLVGEGKNETCDWRYDIDNYYYDTSCGIGFDWLGGLPQDNNYIYCPNCGKSIVTDIDAVLQDE